MLSDAVVSEKAHTLAAELSAFGPTALAAAATILVVLLVRRLLAKGHEAAALWVVAAAILGVVVAVAATGVHTRPAFARSASLPNATNSSAGPRNHARVIVQNNVHVPAARAHSSALERVNNATTHCRDTNAIVSIDKRSLLGLQDSLTDCGNGDAFLDFDDGVARAIDGDVGLAKGNGPVKLFLIGNDSTHCKTSFSWYE